MNVRNEQRNDKQMPESVSWHQLQIQCCRLSMGQSKTFCAGLDLLAECGIPLIAEFQCCDRHSKVVACRQPSDFVSAFLIRASGAAEAPRPHTFLEALGQNDDDVVFDGFAARVRDCS